VPLAVMRRGGEVRQLRAGTTGERLF